MRASEADPARSPEARAKRIASNAKRRKEALTWEKEKPPGPYDPEVFKSEILLNESSDVRIRPEDRPSGRKLYRSTPPVIGLDDESLPKDGSRSAGKALEVAPGNHPRSEDVTDADT